MSDNELKETVMKQKEGMERLSDEMYHTYKEMEDLNLRIESCKEKFETSHKMFRRILLMIVVYFFVALIFAHCMTIIISKS